MANYRGINNDPISVLAGWEQWNGALWVAASAIPTAGDVAYANGFNKRIDQSWTVAEIRNNVFQGTTGSGQFELLDAGITFNGKRINVGYNVPILYVSFGGGVSTVLGEDIVAINNTGSTTPDTVGNTIIEGQSGGVLFVEKCGIDWSSNRGGYGVTVRGSGNGFVLNMAEIGSPNAQFSQHQRAGLFVNGGGYVINLNGSYQPENVFQSNNVWVNGDGNTINVNGYVLAIGSNINESYAIVNTSNSTVNIYGIVEATSFASAIISLGTPSVGSSYLYRYSTLSSVVVRNGSVLVNSDNFNAVVSNGLQIEGDILWQMKTPANQDRNLYTAGLLTGYPLEANVKESVIYGPVGEFTGTYPGINEFTDTVLAAIASIKAVP